MDTDCNSDYVQPNSKRICLEEDDCCSSEEVLFPSDNATSDSSDDEAFFPSDIDTGAETGTDDEAVVQVINTLHRTLAKQSRELEDQLLQDIAKVLI